MVRMSEAVTYKRHPIHTSYFFGDNGTRFYVQIVNNKKYERAGMLFESKEEAYRAAHKIYIQRYLDLNLGV